MVVDGAFCCVGTAEEDYQVEERSRILGPVDCCEGNCIRPEEFESSVAGIFGTEICDDNVFEKTLI